MVATETDLERYADPQAFAREVNLPLLGVARIAPVPSGSGLTTLLAASAGDALTTVVDGLAETRQSLTLRTLLLAGFPHDPECFAVGLALGREWSRRGLRVAIVDLDFWNPTVWRPGSHPNEGFVDVLEYGCSISRVAWEIVADRLWLIGPGSHPPDEERIVEHPDWPRAARVLAMQADVTLFVAPLLDRRGFTGKLSKRVDGALLVASVERTARADLRDAFLELWGSDAPMIGCVGIESVPAQRTAAPRAVSTAGAPSEPSIVAAPPSIAAPPLSGAPMATAPVLPVGRAEPVLSPEERALERELEREVRRGVVKRPPIPGIGKAAIWVGVAGMIAVGIGIFRLVLTPGLGPESGAVIQSQPAGEEAIRPPAEQTPQTPPTQAGLTNNNPVGLSAAVPPSAAPPSAAASLPFCVHVASFKSVEKVREIVRTLAMRGLDAWYEPATDMPGWYRVFVGRFANEAEAKAYASYLLDNHFVDRASSFPSPAR